MGRVLKILSLAVLMFLAYMGISLLTKSWNKESASAKKLTEQSKDKKPDIFEDEEFFAEDDSSSSDQTINYKELDQTIANTKNDIKEKQSQPTTSPVSLPPTTAKEKTNTKPKEEVKPVAKTNTKAKNVSIDKPSEVKTTPNQSKESLSGTGVFTVVAGNYLLEANADQMVNKLKNSGYNSSEKVVFDLSEFYTVIAGKYNNYESASKTVSNLKTKGIDCYIHRNK